MHELSPHFELPGEPATEGLGPGTETVYFGFTAPDEPNTSADQAAAYNVGLGESGDNPMAVLLNDGDEAPGDDTFGHLVREALGQTADGQEFAPDLVLPSGGTPPIKPPRDGFNLGLGELPERPEEGNDEPEPTLEIGEVVVYSVAESGYSPMVFPDFSTGTTGSIAKRTDRIVREDREFSVQDSQTDPNSIEVASDTTIIARGDDTHPITLTAKTQDGPIVTFQHPVTGEGAMVNINPSEAGTQTELELLLSALNRARAFSSRGAIVHVFGGTQEIVSPDGVTQSSAEGIADYLRLVERLPNVTIPHDVEGEIDITMNVHTGVPEARVAGVLVYPYPAEPQAEPAAPETTEVIDTATGTGELAHEEDRDRWSHVLDHVDALIADPTSPQVFIADILPAGSRQIADAETAASEVVMGYTDQIRRRDAPTAPEGRMALLDSQFPDGLRGLDALTYMIQHHSTVLEELNGTAGQTDPQLVLDLLVNRLESAYSELESRAQALASDQREDIAAMRSSLEERRDHLGVKLDQAIALRDRYERGAGQSSE